MPVNKELTLEAGSELKATDISLRDVRWVSLM